MVQTAQPRPVIRSQKRTVGVIIMIACFGLGLLMLLMAVVKGVQMRQAQAQLAELNERLISSENDFKAQEAALSSQQTQDDFSSQPPEGASAMEQFRWESSQRMAQAEQEAQQRMEQFRRRSEHEMSQFALKSEISSAEFSINSKKTFIGFRCLMAVVCFSAGIIGGSIMFKLAKRTEERANAQYMA